uniref:Uncharacterized protein n=1 Tax=Siphoviridae sp. ctn8e14 TaxID=2827936 RepID=A0A8S5T4B5_9CAUD|nr:MAG TPA: hypothetical protein [Siphoviridae sp. ctn8e14]
MQLDSNMKGASAPFYFCSILYPAVDPAMMG